MPSIVPPPTDTQVHASRWIPEETNFLRRVMAGEVYTGMSGRALALWAVGIDDKPRDRPYDRADTARCMNVYWSAPESLRPKMRRQIEAWTERLRREADGEVGWRWEPVDFDTRVYYNPSRYMRVRL